MSQNFANYKEALETGSRTEIDRLAKIIRNEGRDGLYSFNWPYDYFSLVELVKLDTKIDFGKGIIV